MSKKAPRRHAGLDHALNDNLNNSGRTIYNAINGNNTQHNRTEYILLCTTPGFLASNI